MYFLLVNAKSGDFHYLEPKRNYSVGRKDSDILLEQDKSISRQHAVLHVKEDHVLLQDCKSKYKTFHNGTEVNPNNNVKLIHGDTVQFGALNSKFRFESVNFIVSASALTLENKRMLKANLAKCKATYVEKWSKMCTHLTVDKLVLTIKIMQALVNEIPIVTMAYWSDYAKAVEENLPLPDINEYTEPPVGEKLLRADFKYTFDSKRKTLFKNKVFIFLKRAMVDQMEDVIKSCGGSCVSWEEEPKTLLEINKSPLDHLLVISDSDGENASFKAIQDGLKKQGQRPIPINEIALAIINCSCDINCNPSFNKVTKVFDILTQKPMSKEILAKETQTQDVANALEFKTENVILPSAPQDWIQSQTESESHQTKRRAEHDVETPSKRLKTDDERISAQSSKQPVISSVSNSNNNNNNNFEKLVKKPTSGNQVVKPNPFSSMLIGSKKRSREDDSLDGFKPAKIVQSRAVKSSNPFANFVNVQTTPVSRITPESNTEPEVKQELEKSPPISKSNPSTENWTTVEVNTSWLSKNSTRQCVKIEIDPEMIKFVEAFRDCVQVRNMSVVERSVYDESRAVSLDCVDGRINFKKFKKVKPLRPQVTIIGRHNFTKVLAGEVSSEQPVF